VPGAVAGVKSARRLAAKSIPHLRTTLLALFTCAAIACLSLALNDSKSEAEWAAEPGEADLSISEPVSSVDDRG